MNLEEIIEFAFRVNNIEKNAQGYCAKTKESIKKDILASIENNSIYLSVLNNKINGLLVCLKNEERKICDSFMLIESDDYDEIAFDLFKNLKDKEYNYNFFFPIQNENCRNFLEKMDATKEINEYQLLIEKKDFTTYNLNFDNISKIKEAENEGFTKLFNEIFEDIYISALDILTDHNHETYIMTKNDEIVALSVLRKNQGTCGTAEVIGVKQEYRGMGNGKKILSYLLKEALKTYEKVDLIVDGDNYNAIKLYTGIGFKLINELCFYKYKVK